ncbi:Uncharacterised protein [Mycobacteroides abscessus subsp. abscessus]|nr:Uncharacterised protein [Mycobacteroides abscessus subsp. abscessus]SIN13628.1 Uncharacterised protein [Mycobacteroides abscessus subsp. abscessus]SKW29087.1 Uncharacterised protein [Mycobacteroides abscessus subsp. abscessus]
MKVFTTLLSLLSEKKVLCEIIERSKEDRNNCWRLMRP